MINTAYHDELAKMYGPHKPCYIDGGVITVMIEPGGVGSDFTVDPSVLMHEREDGPQQQLRHVTRLTPTQAVALAQRLIEVAVSLLDPQPTFDA